MINYYLKFKPDNKVYELQSHKETQARGEAYHIMNTYDKLDCYKYSSWEFYYTNTNDGSFRSIAING